MGNRKYMKKVTALNHEIFDDPMKETALVALRDSTNFVLSRTELSKVLGCLGNNVGKQLKLDAAGFGGIVNQSDSLQIHNSFKRISYPADSQC